MRTVHLYQETLGFSHHDFLTANFLPAEFSPPSPDHHHHGPTNQSRSEISHAPGSIAPIMGRRPNPLILQYFDRGEKLKDQSNRYPHTCKA